MVSGLHWFSGHTERWQQGCGKSRGCLERDLVLNLPSFLYRLCCNKILALLTLCLFNLKYVWMLLMTEHPKPGRPPPTFRPQETPAHAPSCQAWSLSADARSTVTLAEDTASRLGRQGCQVLGGEPGARERTADRGAAPPSLGAALRPALRSISRFGKHLLLYPRAALQEESAGRCCLNFHR